MLLVVVCFAMLASFAQAKVVHKNTVSKVGNNVWVIPKTEIAPKLDYQIDTVWNAIDGQPLQYFNYGSSHPSDWTDLSGWVKLLWDDKNLYGLFYSCDNFIDSVSATDWQMDGDEFYMDAGNTHVPGSSLSAIPNAYQFCFRPPQNIDSVENAYKHGVQYIWFVDTASANNGGPTGWFCEFQIPLDSLSVVAQAGTKVSLELQQDDNDGAGRIHLSKWANGSGVDDDWQNTQHWGDAVLGDSTTGEYVDNACSYVFLHTTKAPTLTADVAPNGGPSENVWSDANQATPGGLTYGGLALPTDPQDQSWRFYGLYDDNNVYGFFIVYDNFVDSVSATDWQMDGIEFYTDNGNTHVGGSSLSAIAGAHQFECRPPQNVDSVENGVKHGMEYTWKVLPNIPNDSIFSSMSGYAVQFQFSLDSLGILAAGGTRFSFELQTDDNDGSGRIHLTKWWNPSKTDDDWQNTSHWGNAILSSANVLVGVKQPAPPVANKFRLDQNFPNPFNPSTKVTYSVDKTGYTTLKVYNVLGQEVATLFSGVRSAGQEYTATFDASRLTSGVYFYKLEAGNQMLVKKMMLLK